jgi:hypothetical protein
VLAEIHGKLASDSGSEYHRLEDLLTDYVFGTLKYLDRRYLGAVLREVAPAVDWSSTGLEAAAFSFWPQLPGGTEPDVMVAAGNELIIFEAKLHSGFGVGAEKKDNQLIREWRHGRRWATPRRFSNPKVVAVTANYDMPDEVDAAGQFIEREYGVADAVSWVSWQRIAQLIEEEAVDSPPSERMMIEDLLEVMERRGVRRVFTGFNQEDYWVVAAGTRIAADRIYPAIATFAEELYEQCVPLGITRGAREKKIVTNLSASLGNPHLWGVTYINVPLWSEAWPERRRSVNAMLFVQFPLTEPVLRVGYRLSINPKRKDAWHRYVPDLVRGLAEADGYEVAVMRYPDLGAIAERINTADLTDAWLRNAIDRADTIALQRSLPLDDLVQTAIIRDMLEEDVVLLNSNLRQLVDEAEYA